MSADVGKGYAAQAGSRATQQTGKSAVQCAAASPAFNHTRRKHAVEPEGAVDEAAIVGVGELKNFRA